MTVAEQVLQKLQELSPEKQEKVLEYVDSLTQQESKNLPLKSLKGLWRGMGFHVTEADIAEARREMWSNFPREFPTKDDEQ